jgi:Ubiquitin carboxyl-terminal hydrolase
MASPDTITTPVAPVRKARRRTLTLERQESRGRTRTRVKTPDAEAESETSGAELDDESISISIDSSKSSLPTSEAPIVKLPSVPRLAVSEESSTSPITLERKISIPRSSISSAPPRYILRKAFKRIKLQSPLPPVMILHLKRFYGTYTGSMKKIDDFVSFETEFDFSPYVFPPSIKKSKLMYSLTGVVIHLGSINSGQYFSLNICMNIY